MKSRSSTTKIRKYAKILPGQNCGSLYRTFYAQRGAVKGPPQWNRMEITAKGRYIKIMMNGQKVVEGNINDVRDPEILQKHPGLLRTKGHIGFLGHNSEVEFRNVRIKEMKQFYDRDNSPPAGFAALFNGRDLSGWKGLVEDPPKRAKMSAAELAAAQKIADQRMRDHWKVENGALVFDGKGDSLCTAKDYGDFEMLVDWKILPERRQWHLPARLAAGADLGAEQWRGGPGPSRLGRTLQQPEEPELCFQGCRSLRGRVEPVSAS